VSFRFTVFPTANPTAAVIAWAAQLETENRKPASGNGKLLKGRGLEGIPRKSGKLGGSDRRVTRPPGTFRATHAPGREPARRRVAGNQFPRWVGAPPTIHLA